MGIGMGNRSRLQVLQMGAYPPPQGGVQTHIVALRQHLLDCQIPCSVINLTRHRSGCAEGLHHPTRAWQVLKLLSTLPYNVVHLHHGGELTRRLLALYAYCSLLPGKRTVLTCHSGGYASDGDGVSARPFSMAGIVFRRLDRIIGVNQQLCDVFVRFGVPQNRVRLILPFGIQAPPQDRPLPARLSDFFARHDPVLLSVGLLEHEYDLPLQVRLLGRVREHYPRAGLALIGSGSLHDSLLQQIGATPYADHVLLCSDVPHLDTLCAIRDCTLLLRTTHFDGDAVSVREALFLGTPVIASDNGMRPDGVHLFPTRDEDSLVGRVLQLLASPPPRVSLGTSGERNMQAVVDLYQELLP